MKILFISPGAGDSYYCGNCFRDSLQAAALQKTGHDVTVMPLYLPILYGTEGVPVFFPAISYYLEQKLFKKGNMPAWLERLASSKSLLGLAASMSGTTSASGMEGMTMSMISGADAAFRKNWAEMEAWIRADGAPDLVHLSSSLLIGMARMVKEAFGIPVVCSLQDEEVWIDGLEPEWADAAWKTIAANAAYVDAFVVSSEYYRAIALKRMPDCHPTLIYPGFDIDKYRYETLPEDPTIGFFYRMNDLDGLDILADAFVLLKERNSVPNLKLRIGGGSSGSDRRFINRVKERLRPFREDVTWCEDYSPVAHHLFYRDITVLSVPLRFDEAVGLYVCEAFATGRPVVEPDRGSFPEIVGDGGLLYAENTPEELANALETIFLDRNLQDRCRAGAIRLAKERYAGEGCARSLEALYEKLIQIKTI